MQKRVTFRGMEHTPVLEEFANKHLERIEKLLINEPTPISIDLVLNSSPNHAHYRVELRVSAPQFTLDAHHEGPEMYQEIDTVIEKMVREIKKAKDKLDDEKKHGDSYKGAGR